MPTLYIIDYQQKMTLRILKYLVLGIFNLFKRIQLQFEWYGSGKHTCWQPAAVLLAISFVN